MYYLNDTFTGRANIELAYGDHSDEVYVGDWDGNGTDTLMVRRGNTFHVRNSATSGPADVLFSYGDRGDTVLVGDWDGDGTDTLAVRRGNRYFVKNDITTGYADYDFYYGNPADDVLVGNWDGDTSSADATRPVTSDTLMVRRGNRFFVKNSTDTGYADYDFFFGDPGDTLLVGDWADGPSSAGAVGLSGDYASQLMVRRGNRYFESDEVWTAEAVRTGHGLRTRLSFLYGDPADTAFVAALPYRFDDTGQVLFGDGLAVRRVTG
jgi:hypothetical protein